MVTTGVACQILVAMSNNKPLVKLMALKTKILHKKLAIFNKQNHSLNR
jgi:hypothetical protein